MQDPRGVVPADILDPITPRPLQALPDADLEARLRDSVAKLDAARTGQAAATGTGIGPADALRGALGDLIVATLRANREAVVAGINARIDIPFVPEAAEGRLYGAVYDVAVDVVAGLVGGAVPGDGTAAPTS